MRARTAAAAGLAAIVAIVSIALVADSDARKRKRKRRSPRSNAPAGWTWPPSDAMERQGAECLIRLDERGVKFRKAKRRPRIATPVIVEDMTFGGVELVPRFRKPPFPMDCHLALALARIGPTLRELGVVELRFSTIHDVRKVRVNGGTKNTLSRHSFGLAMDVFELVDDDGTLWVIESDYDAGDSVLHEIEAAVNDSENFRRLLTPGNDPVSHDDHYHFEAEVPKLKLTDAEKKAKRKEARRKRRKAKRERRRKARRRRSR